jgi:hypothetical protein
VPLIAFGCNSLRMGPPPATRLEKPEQEATIAAPGRHSLRVSQFVFLSDFKLKDDLPLFRELAEMRDQIHKQLQLPSSNTIVQVYLFEDRDRYERFMDSRYRGLPRRRAFFVAQPRSVGGEDLLVYTYWGDRVQQDLRHELTHALLHSVLKDVPLWLDEGLAEYYEMPPRNQGVNHGHLEMLRRELVMLNLARLEKLTEVEQMKPPEYREAWAWVHLMLHSTPEAKGVLLKYLQQLRTNPHPGPLQPNLTALLDAPEKALGKHLTQVDQAMRQ